MSDQDLAAAVGVWTLGVTIMYVLPASMGVPMDKPGIEQTLAQNAIWFLSMLVAVPFVIHGTDLFARHQGGSA